MSATSTPTPASTGAINTVSIQIGRHLDQWLTLSATMLTEMQEVVLNKKYVLTWTQLGDDKRVQVLVLKEQTTKRGKRKTLRWVMDKEQRLVCRDNRSGMNELYWSRGLERA